MTTKLIPFGESCWQCEIRDDAGELLFLSRPFGWKAEARAAADWFSRQMPRELATAQVAGELF